MGWKHKHTADRGKQPKLSVPCIGTKTLSATIEVRSVKLCMILIMMELYPFIPVSTTLTHFQGQSSVRMHNGQNEKLYFPGTVWYDGVPIFCAGSFTKRFYVYLILLIEGGNWGMSCLGTKFHASVFLDADDISSLKLLMIASVQLGTIIPVLVTFSIFSMESLKQQ